MVFNLFYLIFILLADNATLKPRVLTQEKDGIVIYTWNDTAISTSKVTQLVDFLVELSVNHTLPISIGRKLGNVLFNNTLNTFYFTVIWRRRYGKGPLR